MCSSDLTSAISSAVSVLKVAPEMCIRDRAGVALGFLLFKPQFLIAVPLVLLLSQAWKPLIGLVLSASAQLFFTRIYFGPASLQTYFDTLRHMSQVIDGVELSLAPIPVSYTHLDVYKRQPYIAPPLEAILHQEGLTPVIVETTEFEKAGGSCFCMKTLLP